MIEALSRFDKKVALGLLARAALSFEDDANPAAAARLPGELDLRSEIYTQVRKAVGVDEGDSSGDASEKIEAALDLELDKLAEFGDNDAVLRDLSQKGQLPSDLYGISIIENVQEIYRKHWFQERKIIHETIKAPDREQHFVAHPGQVDGPLVSLFVKHYPNKYPNKSYLMLVVGQRTDLTMYVHQAWRLYRDQIDIAGTTDLVELLKRFTDVFGLDFKIGNVEGKFQLDLETTPSESLERRVELKPIYGTDRRGRKVEKSVNWTFSVFTASDRQTGKTSILTTVIDLDKYAASLAAHAW